MAVSKTKTFLVIFSSQDSAAYREVHDKFTAFRKAEQERLSKALGLPVKITAATALLSLMRSLERGDEMEDFSQHTIPIQTHPSV